MGWLPDKLVIQFAQANGSMPTALPIAQSQASLNPRVMVGIGTPAAQTLLKKKPQESTLAFVAVTDPHIAGLRGVDVIGVTDSLPLEELLDVVEKVIPQVKNIGVLYNPGESNSVSTLEALEKIAQRRHLKIHKIAVNGAQDIKPALGKLAPRVEVIYLPQDNTVVSALPLVIKETLHGKHLSRKIPLICNDPSSVNQGVLLGLGCDYEKSGEQLGGMIADVLEGKTLTLPIQRTHIQELRVNGKSAALSGIKIPQSILHRAIP